jgi:hypothetical protein
MRIHEQGDTVRLIRSERLPGWPRPRQKVVGTFRRDRGPTQSLLDALTDDERDSLSQWLSVRQVRDAHHQHQRTLDAAHAQLVELVAAVDAAAELITPAQVDTLWNDLAAIARALRRAGYPKPKRERKPPPAPPGQGDLLASNA